MDDKEFNEKYEKLKNSKFKQQKLNGWRPIPTISCITIIYISFGLFFLIFGVIIVVFTSQLKEIKYRYDEYCSRNNNNVVNGKIECTFIFTVHEKMSKPIMIYYQIDDFSQNHRVYMDSKSEKQLKGEQVSKEDLEKSGECEHRLLKKDFGSGSNPGNPDELQNPCGLIAYSYLMVDIFTDWKLNGNSLTIKEEEIAFKSDMKKYGDIQDKEHFLIWLRPSPFSNPRKLWGKIEEDDIEKDSSLSVKITSSIEYFGYKKKYIILSTRNVFGGKNLFLGVCYIIFGIFCLMASVIFIICFDAFHKKNK